MGKLMFNPAADSLPAVTSSDNGKVLKVSDGQWAAGTLDISGKADKVTGATNGNVAALDSNGNLTDSGKTLGKSVPSDAVFTDTTYSAATTSADGLMSAADKIKLNGIATGANKTTVSNSLTDTSTTNALSAAKGKELNDKTTDYVKIVQHSLGSTGTIAAGNTKYFSGVNVSSSIPAGYKLIGVCAKATGNDKVAFYVLDVATATTITVGVVNLGGSSITVKPWVYLICIKS